MDSCPEKYPLSRQVGEVRQGDGEDIMPDEEEDNNDEDEDEVTRTGFGDQQSELRDRPVEM